MAKSAPRFVCQSCGAVTAKWVGRCEACGEWNTIVEEAGGGGPALGAKPGNSRKIAFVGLAGDTEPPPRAATTIAELDRVLGGGFVPGSAVLLGGDPGIGKSTLLLQAAAALARSGRRVSYISGEEAIDQVRLRARRLGLTDAPLDLATAINVRDIVASLETTEATLVVIDSIQTMWLDSIDSAPGSVTQVRSSAFELIRLAKARGFSVVLVGHVTKDGAIAGPRVLEHMVDAVLHFEGDRGHQFRILRANKNRFGATDEIGVFEMTDRGLAEVANPSALFLAERRGNVAGNAVFAGLEGTPTGAAGSPGPAGRQSGRQPAPVGGGMGLGTAVDAAGGAGVARRIAAGGDRCMAERGRWPAGNGAGGRSGGRSRHRLRRRRRADRPELRVLRRDRAVGRSTASRAGGIAAEGSSEARVFRRLPAAPGGPGQPHPRGTRGAAHHRGGTRQRPADTNHRQSRQPRARGQVKLHLRKAIWTR